LKSVIENPVEHANMAASEYKLLYGRDLVSVILYGSAIRGDFNPEKSDINLLVVLSSMDIGLICRSADIQAKYMRKRFSKPLFMDKEYIISSSDSYPMEFLDIKEHYRVLTGEDVLSTISPEKEHLRLQVERELKGKWLHLIDEYTSSYKNRKQLIRLSAVSLKALAPVFRMLLKLKNHEIPSGKRELLAALEKSYLLNGSPFQNIEKIGNDDSSLEKKFTDYSRAVKSLIDSIENK
jgi:Nucleotidyltransferase domain.